MNAFIKFVTRRLLRDPSTLLLPLLALTSTLALLVTIKKPEINWSSERQLVTSILPLLAIISTLAVFMLKFLSPSSKVDEDVSERELWMLQKRLEETIEEKRSISRDDQNSLIDLVTRRISDAATDEFLNDLSGKLEARSLFVVVEESATNTVKRIYREIDALGRRGSLNLVLGVVMALSGIGFLAYMVLGLSEQHTTITSFLVAFLPRLSVVAIVELFSYFFLRLYKASLADIKYFQNEATNIEAKLLALRVALQLKSAADIKASIEAFLAVDRNILLAAGVTTREIEDAKLFKDPSAVSLQTLVEIIKALPGKKELNG